MRPIGYGGGGLGAPPPPKNYFDAPVAVTKGGRGRPVFEHMAEVAAAAATMNFGPHHAVSAVLRGLDRTGLWIVEARPAGAAFELLLRDEQLLPAPRAGKRAGALLVIERAASRPLGAVLAHDVELLGGQDLAPLGFGVAHRIGFDVHVVLLRGRSTVREYCLPSPPGPTWRFRPLYSARIHPCSC